MLSNVECLHVIVTVVWKKQGIGVCRKVVLLIGLVRWCVADFQLQFSPLVLPFKYSFSNFQSREFRSFFFCHCLTYCVNLICGPSSCGSSPVHSLLVGNFWPGVRAFCISSMLPSSIKFMLGYYIIVFVYLLLAWVLLPMMAGAERSWIASG